jgi:cytochrome c peroxidase
MQSNDRIRQSRAGIATFAYLAIASSLSCSNSSDPDPPAASADGGQQNPGQPTVCTAVNLQSVQVDGGQEDPDIAHINAEIDATEASSLAQARSVSSFDTYTLMTLLGTLELFDKNLSVFRNVACVTCHVPEAGFTGGSSLLNSTVVAQPGSVPITNATDGHPNYRLSNRKPQTYSYAAFAPILHYNATQGTFYGGNFWDFRATGTRLGNPAAEQAEGPPTNPVEMALPDTACAVYRIATGAYAPLFELLWGQSSFAIQWPADVEQVCNQPAPAPASDPLPVHLSATDRQASNDAYDHMALAMAQYEASPTVSAFSSKFDAFLAGTVSLSGEEQLGWELFRGKAKCNQCHLDGTAAAGNDAGAPTPADVAPLFTDFTNNNIGLPRYGCLPWYAENVPDQYGYVANPAGTAFTDLGLGSFLAGDASAPGSVGGGPNPAPAEWGPLATQTDGTFKTATVRNVDKRPRPDFVKAYMHNGYLKSLTEVVHFYNTSQSLPRCPMGSPGEKTTCWPPPEVPSTLNTTQLGNLQLTASEEQAIVAFLETLTDGFVSATDGGTADAAADAGSASP